MPLPQRPCPSCKGTGRVMVQNFADDGQHESSCRICHSRGVLPPSLDDALELIADLESKLEATLKAGEEHYRQLMEERKLRHSLEGKLADVRHAMEHATEIGRMDHYSANTINEAVKL